MQSGIHQFGGICKGLPSVDHMLVYSYYENGA